MNEQYKKEWICRYANVFCKKGVQWQIAEYCAAIAFSEFSDMTPEDAAEQNYKETN